MPAFEETVDQLTDRSSRKRRSAAKRLRTLADPSAGQVLLDALQAEVLDPRTWETQYQMIMALGTCKHEPAFEFLDQLATHERDYTMVGVALGDALVRIEWGRDTTLTIVDRYMPAGSPGVVDGMFRAIAMLRLAPDDKLVSRMVAFAANLGLTDPRRFWVAAAAAGWTGSHVDAFLRACLKSPRSDLVDAAKASLTGTYTRYRPL